MSRKEVKKGMTECCLKRTISHTNFMIFRLTVGWLSYLGLISIKFLLFGSQLSLSSTLLLVTASNSEYTVLSRDIHFGASRPFYVVYR
jgi:hypothetical protein